MNELYSITCVFFFFSIDYLKSISISLSVIEMSRQLHGTGYLTYDSTKLPNSYVRYRWVNGIAFKTRETNGVLMNIVLSSGYVLIKV